jgi:putative transposase
MRQLIVDLRVELPTMSLREIAEICEARFNRRPSHNSVKMVLASGPPPSITTRRYPTWDQIPEPAERRIAVVRLHAEGWSVASMAEYFAVSKQTIYTTLKRWVTEGVKGLDDKSHTRKAPRKVTLEIANEIRKKQENPLIGEWRMHACRSASDGHQGFPPRTCGRIMAKNRALYGWNKPKAPAKPKKEMPLVPLGDTNFGVLISDISSITNSRISKGRCM